MASRKNQVVRFRLASQQRKLLGAAARSAGLDLSSWIRSVTAKEAATMLERTPDVIFRQLTSPIELELSLDLQKAIKPFSVANRDTVGAIRFLGPDGDVTVAFGIVGGAGHDADADADWANLCKRAEEVEVTTPTGLRGGFPVTEWPIHRENFGRIAEAARTLFAGGSPTVSVELIPLCADSLQLGPTQPFIEGAGQVAYPSRPVRLPNGVTARLARVASAQQATVVAYSLCSR